MWPFKKKPVETPVADEVKPEEPEEKELPELKWELSVGPWHKSSRCEHCGHVWTDDTKSNDEDPCPTCGCIGSHKMQVVRCEFEHTQTFKTTGWDFLGELKKHGLDRGQVDHLGGYGPYRLWRGARNWKTVVWDGCSVKKDSNDK